MTITAIKQQERLRTRYSIHVDGVYSFSLSADTLLTERLTTGQEVDAVQLKRYKKLSADDKAYSLALTYVIRRQRSKGELIDYFRRKGHDSGLSQQIMKKLEQLGLVDDEQFAEAWVRNRRILKPVSQRRLIQELRQKHIDESTISRAVDVDKTDELQILREIVARKRKQSKYHNDLKLMQYLARQGFSYEDIRTTLEQDQSFPEGSEN